MMTVVEGKENIEKLKDRIFQELGAMEYKVTKKTSKRFLKKALVILDDMKYDSKMWHISLREHIEAKRYGKKKALKIMCGIYGNEEKILYDIEKYYALKSIAEVMETNKYRGDRVSKVLIYDASPSDWRIGKIIEIHIADGTHYNGHETKDNNINLKLRNEDNSDTIIDIVGY